MAYLLGIDVATIGTKALLIDEKGKVVARTTKEYPFSIGKQEIAEATEKGVDSYEILLEGAEAITKAHQAYLAKMVFASAHLV